MTDQWWMGKQASNVIDDLRMLDRGDEKRTRETHRRLVAEGLAEPDMVRSKDGVLSFRLTARGLARWHAGTLGTVVVLQERAPPAPGAA